MRPGLAHEVSILIAMIGADGRCRGVEPRSKILVEIDAGLQRRDVEGGMPDDSLIAGILGSEEDELLLAEVYDHGALLRLETPRQARLRVPGDCDHCFQGIVISNSRAS